MSFLERFGIYRRPPRDAAPDALTRDIEDEFEAHLAHCADELVAAGIEPAEARRRAEERFGDRARAVAACRAVHMEEREMLQRIQVGLSFVVAVALVWFMVRTDARLTALHERLSAAAVASPEPATQPVAMPRFDLPAADAQRLADWLRVWVPPSPAPAAAPATTPPVDGPRVYVLGSVEHARPVALRPRLTLLGAVSECGGFGKFADTSRVRILRGDSVIEVDMDAVRSGRRPDPELEDGDRIDVPEAFF